MQKLTAFALGALLAFAAHAETEARDDQDLMRAGCRVRTAQVDVRGIATVAAECSWQRTPDAVLGVLRNPALLGAALSSLGECKRLPGGRVLQVHTVGWPLDDRQITLDWRETALPDGGVRFDYARAAQQEPLGAGRVEILEDEGRWEIRPDGAGGTKLSYSSRYDAGGNLKPWVVRRFQKDGIATSLEELLAVVPQH
jgi:Polyketide cyclase / dehydrase and lipid transport